MSTFSCPGRDYLPIGYLSGWQGKDGSDKVFKGAGYLALEETKLSEPISGYTAKGPNEGWGFEECCLHPGQSWSYP